MGGQHLKSVREGVVFWSAKPDDIYPHRWCLWIRSQTAFAFHMNETKVKAFFVMWHWLLFKCEIFNIGFCRKRFAECQTLSGSPVKVQSAISENQEENDCIFSDLNTNVGVSMLNAVRILNGDALPVWLEWPSSPNSSTLDTPTNLCLWTAVVVKTLQYNDKMIVGWYSLLLSTKSILDMPSLYPGI